MSSQSSCLHRPVHVFVLAVLTLAAVLASPPAAIAGGAAAPAELRLNTTLRHDAVEPAPGAVAAARFRVEIPQAGLLALDLSVPAGAQPEPVLRLLDRSPAARRVSQTPDALLVEARETGELLVEVAAVEPDQSLPAFKLRSAFEAMQSALGDTLDDAVDPWDDDLPGKQPPAGGGSSGGNGLCALGEQDDHGDTPLCATPISSAEMVAGVLHNDTGDDEDLFLFRLPATEVVAIEAASDSALHLVLRDGDGLAVATARSEGAEAPLHLARALAAGRYFLAVESPTGDDAVYALTLHRPSRP